MKTELSPRRWLIVAFLTLFMSVMNFNLIVYPACAVDTMAVYGVDQAALTTFASVTSVVGVLGGIVFGPLLDKKGSRNVVMISMIIGIVLFAVRAFVTSYVLALILTFLASFFIGVCQVAAPKVLDTWFTKETVGIAVAFQAGGAGLGGAFSFFLAGSLGLQTCLLIIAIAYAALLVLWIAVGKDGPIAVQVDVPKGGVAKVYKSKYVWLISIAYACCVCGTMLINTYIVNAFMIGKGAPQEVAATLGGIICLSLFVGGYLGTFLMKVIKRYNVVLAICVIGGAIGYLLCWWVPFGPLTYVFMILGGLIMGGGILMCVSRTPLIPLTGQFPRECIGTASGALEVIKGIIAFVLPIIIAQVFGTNFDAIFIVFAVFCGLALLTGTILVPEVGPGGKLYKASVAKQESEK